jgi:riboflavin synthase
MFTGIILEVGRVEEMRAEGEGRRLRIAAPETARALGLGGSVAVNGCCLTAEEVEGGSFRLFCSGETISRTNLDALRTGSSVNLELPLSPSSPLGGHFVQGHVDGVGQLVQVRREGEAGWIRVSVPKEIRRYLVEKGSVAIDGISLTVARLQGDTFEVAVIPETWKRTTLADARPGARVNLEADILAKYVESLLPGRK